MIEDIRATRGIAGYYDGHYAYVDKTLHAWAHELSHYISHDTPMDLPEYQEGIREREEWRQEALARGDDPEIVDLTVDINTNHYLLGKDYLCWINPDRPEDCIAIVTEYYRDRLNEQFAEALSKVISNPLGGILKHSGNESTCQMAQWFARILLNDPESNLVAPFTFQIDAPHDLYVSGENVSVEEENASQKRFHPLSQGAFALTSRESLIIHIPQEGLQPWRQVSLPLPQDFNYGAEAIRTTSDPTTLFASDYTGIWAETSKNYWYRNVADYDGDWFLFHQKSAGDGGSFFRRLRVNAAEPTWQDIATGSLFDDEGFTSFIDGRISFLTQEGYWIHSGDFSNQPIVSENNLIPYPQFIREQIQNSKKMEIVHAEGRNRTYLWIDGIPNYPRGFISRLFEMSINNENHIYFRQVFEIPTTHTTSRPFLYDDDWHVFEMIVNGRQYSWPPDEGNYEFPTYDRVLIKINRDGSFTPHPLIYDSHLDRMKGMLHCNQSSLHVSGGRVVCQRQWAGPRSIFGALAAFEFDEPVGDFPEVSLQPIIELQSSQLEGEGPGYVYELQAQMYDPYERVILNSEIGEDGEIIVSWIFPDGTILEQRRNKDHANQRYDYDLGTIRHRFSELGDNPFRIRVQDGNRTRSFEIPYFISISDFDNHTEILEASVPPTVRQGEAFNIVFSAENRLRIPLQFVIRFGGNGQEVLTELIPYETYSRGVEVTHTYGYGIFVGEKSIRIQTENVPVVPYDMETELVFANAPPQISHLRFVGHDLEPGQPIQFYADVTDPNQLPSWDPNYDVTPPDPLTYQWIFSDGVIVDNVQEAQIIHTFYEDGGEGPMEVTLVVTDSHGAEVQASLEVTPANRALGIRVEEIPF